MLTNSEGETTYYSPWFPRRSDAATFFLEVMHRSRSNASMTVGIFHKNEEDADPGTSVSTFSVASAVGVYKKAVTGLKEMIRFEFQGSTQTATNEWMHFPPN
jgi:hypothetical protein